MKARAAPAHERSQIVASASLKPCWVHVRRSRPPARSASSVATRSNARASRPGPGLRAALRPHRTRPFKNAGAMARQAAVRTHHRCPSGLGGHVKCKAVQNADLRLARSDRAQMNAARQRARLTDVRTHPLVLGADSCVLMLPLQLRARAWPALPQGAKPSMPPISAARHAAERAPPRPRPGARHTERACSSVASPGKRHRAPTLHFESATYTTLRLRCLQRRANESASSAPL